MADELFAEANAVADRSGRAPATYRHFCTKRLLPHAFAGGQGTLLLAKVGLSLPLARPLGTPSFVMVVTAGKDGGLVQAAVHALFPLAFLLDGTAKVWQ